MVKRGVPAIAVRRHAEARDKIMAKVELLEAWRREGTPRGQHVPTSQEQFRTWNDEKLGVSAIGSKSTLHTRQNADLKVRLNRVLTHFFKLTSANRTRRERKALRAERQEETIKDLKQRIRELAGQYTVARHELLREQELRLRAEDRLKQVIAGVGGTIRQMKPPSV